MRTSQHPSPAVSGKLIPNIVNDATELQVPDPTHSVIVLQTGLNAVRMNPGLHWLTRFIQHDLGGIGGDWAGIEKWTSFESKHRRRAFGRGDEGS